VLSNMNEEASQGYPPAPSQYWLSGIHIISRPGNFPISPCFCSSLPQCFEGLSKPESHIWRGLVLLERKNKGREYSLCVTSAGDDVPIRVGELN